MIREFCLSTRLWVPRWRGPARAAAKERSAVSTRSLSEGQAPHRRPRCSSPAEPAALVSLEPTCSRALKQTSLAHPEREAAEAVRARGGERKEPLDPSEPQVLTQGVTPVATLSLRGTMRTMMR